MTMQSRLEIIPVIKVLLIQTLNRMGGEGGREGERRDLGEGKGDERGGKGRREGREGVEWRSEKGEGGTRGGVRGGGEPRS